MEKIFKKKLDLYKGRDVEESTFEQSKIVRIFVSSTFSDMKVERDYLMERAYPQLRSYCQNKEIDFQIIDMRWGIQDSASVDHSTCDLCLMEIKTCKRMSLGPFFVAFVGNRYGYRPLPPTILSREYDVLFNDQFLDDELRVLFETWYVLDTNAVPSQRVLQPINKILPHFDDSNPDNLLLRNKARASWYQVSSKLETNLRKAALEAKENGLMNAKDVEKFFQSVTEFEIREGFMKKPAASRLYHRNIIDIDRYTKDSAIENFIDLNDETINQQAQDSLKNLKEYLQRTATKSGSIKTYDVNWSNETGISEEDEEHRNYLKRFCQDFVDDIKEAIDRNVSGENNEIPEQDGLFEEVAHHAYFAKSKISSFCGRQYLLDKIKSVLFKSDNNNPVALHGISGSGKTSVMAKMKEICLGHSKDPIVITRFFGTSPNSSQIHLVLKSLVLQLSTIFGQTPPPSHVLESFVKMTQKFEELLIEISQQTEESGQHVFIILDSIDQLSPLDGAYRLNWLPKTLPPRIKFLVSTLPSPEIKCLGLLKRVLPQQNVIEVTDMNASTGKEILRSFLAKIGRTLTKEQQKVVMNAFMQCPNPLFMKLAFDEAKRWHSYTKPKDTKLSGSVRASINSYFDRLEAKHSFMFTSRAIGYIVAARNGLMESELDDLLSLDDDVLDNAYQYWPPPNKNVVRIPALLWVRLRHDLGENLVERQSVGKTVLALYHRQFVELARERYLQGKAKIKIHSSIALYFLGTYSDGKTKTLLLKIWDMEPVVTDRKVASQPLEITKGVYNLRKLDELPYHLFHACGKDNLIESFAGRVLCEEILCNAKWLQAKINAFSITDVLNDYDMVLTSKYDKSIELIAEALKISKPTLEFLGGVRNSLTVEMFGRLHYFKNKYPETLDPFLKQCDEMNRDFTGHGLIPLAAGFQPPGEELKTTLIGLSGPVTCVASFYDERQNYLAAGSVKGEIIVWDMKTDEILHTFKPHTSAVLALDIKGLSLASASSDSFIHIHSLDTGSCVNSFKDSNINSKEFTRVATTKKGDIIASCTGRKVSVFDVKTGCRLHELVKPKSSSLSCEVVITNKLIVCGYEDGEAVGWNLKDGNINFKYHPKKPLRKTSVKKIEVCENDDVECSWSFGCFARLHLSKLKWKFQIDEFTLIAKSDDFIAVAEGKWFSVWIRDDETFQKLANLKYHSDIITSLAWLPSRQNSTKKLAVGSRDNQISIWSLEKSEDTYKVRSAPSDVIIGMGASVDYIIPVDDCTLITASREVFYLKVWNVEEDDSDEALVRVKNLSLTESNHDVDGRYLVMFDRPSMSVKTYDISNLPAVSLLETSSIGKNNERDRTLLNPVMVKISADLKQVFCAFENGQLTIVPMLQNRESSGRKRSSSVITSQSHSRVTACCLGNDERFFLVNLHLHDDGENNLVVVDTVTMKVVHLSALSGFGCRGRVSCIATTSSSDDRTMTIFLGSDQNEINVLNYALKQGRKSLVVDPVVSHYKLQGHVNPLTSLKLNDRCDLLLSGTDGKIRKLWKFDEQLNRWSYNMSMESNSFLDSKVSSVAFTPDGKFVVIGSHERNIKIYEISTGKEVASQYVYAPVVGITVCEQVITLRTNQGFIISDLFCKIKSSSNKIVY